MSVLYKIAPQFLLENRLCWLRTPLWIVKNKRTEQYFFTDEEMDLARKQGKAVGEIQRAKGIGSLSPDQAHAAMFTEQYQRLETLAPTPEALQLLVDLMGDDNTKRKDFVFNNIDFSIIRE